MTTQNVARLAHLSSQLAESLMTAVICADEIRVTIRTEIEHLHGGPATEVGETNRATIHRPMLDESTFSVMWQGKSLYLGHTRLFWVLNRLARKPGQFVTHLDLLHDVWDDEELTTATIRSVIRHLRCRLRNGGMEGLAAAIQGHNGHYALIF
jgi:DNA-binding response OmpR family regulator